MGDLEFGLCFGGCEVLFMTERGYGCFRSGCGLVVFRRFGGVVVVVGGLVGGDKVGLVRDVLGWVSANGWRVCFFNVGAGDRDVLSGFGFNFWKVGEEAFVDLGGWSGRGGEFEWVRRQRNFCLRRGLVVEEVLGVPGEGVVGELEGLCEFVLRGRAQRREWGLLQSSVRPLVWGGRRLWVVRDGGVLVGFLVALPYRGGFLFDVYRHDGSVRGVVPFIFMEVLDLLKREGVGEVSLALVPGRGCGGLFERVVMGVPCLFDGAGIDHFKSRFRPRYEERFVCSLPGASVRGVIDVVKGLGVFDVDFWKLVHLWRAKRGYR